MQKRNNPNQNAKVLLSFVQPAERKTYQRMLSLKTHIQGGAEHAQQGPNRRPAMAPSNTASTAMAARRR
jgi:hypothetical protein